MLTFFKKPIGIVFIILAATGGIGAFIFLNKPAAPAYEFVIAETQNLVQEVSVTGRVQPAETVDLSFEKTGTVQSLFVEVGQTVEPGQLLAQLNTQDAQKEVRNAEVALGSAQLTLETIIRDQQQQLRGDVLNKNYEDGLALLGNLYNEFDSILKNLDDIYFGTDLSSGGETNIQYYANTNVNTALTGRIQKLFNETKVLHTQSLSTYLIAERGTGEIRMQAIQSGYDLALKTAETIKTGRDAVRYFQDTILSGSTIHTKQAIIDAHANNLTVYATSMDTYLESLIAITNTISSQEDTLNNYPLTIKSQEITIIQKENDLLDAKDNLAKYSIRSPIHAIVTKKGIRVGEIVSANTPIITVISKTKFEVVVHMPEADIAKISINNPAAITLDAYGRDIIFKARVTKLDPAEVIIDGVPTYKVTLQFTNADSRIRSGMTANIIITAAEINNVIAIPQRAIIREKGKKYVQIVQGSSIQKVIIETGLQASDGNIEIISGVAEGDNVITFFPD